MAVIFYYPPTKWEASLPSHLTPTIVADNINESNHWHLLISPDATSTTDGAIGPLPPVTTFFYPGQVIARWRRPVAYKVALDMLRRVMRSLLHRHIVMAVKTAHDGGTFVRYRLLFCLTNRSKKKNYSHYKLTASYAIVHYNVIS